MKLWRLFFSSLANWFLVLNWVIFLWMSALMASGKQGLYIFFTLPWGSFLTELAQMTTQTAVNSGSVWIAWLALSLFFTLAKLGRQESPHRSQTHSSHDVASLVKNKKREIESDPDLKQSLSKLNQLLKNS